MHCSAVQPFSQKEIQIVQSAESPYVGRRSGCTACASCGPVPSKVRAMNVMDCRRPYTTQINATFSGRTHLLRCWRRTTFCQVSESLSVMTDGKNINYFSTIVKLIQLLAPLPFPSQVPKLYCIPFKRRSTRPFCIPPSWSSW